MDQIQKYLQRIEESDSNSFLYVNPNAEKEAKNADGKLAGMAFAIKSNINVKGLPVTCASKVLGGKRPYIGTFDADVISRIRAEGGVILGMTNMDEFACGSSGESSAFGPSKNPAAREHIPGGSSSGSAAAVAEGLCDAALGSDTGGSIRNPASHCGVVGIKPRYGRVSRHGLIDLSMSLDQIGPFSRDVETAARVLEVIAGPSPNDPTTIKSPVGNLTIPKRGRIKFGISGELDALCHDPRIMKVIHGKLEGLSPVDVSLDGVDLAVQAYYPLVYVEFFSGTRRFDGRKYGEVIEEVAGPEVLRRIMGGREISKAEFKGRYYRMALAVKKSIAESFSRAFRKTDVIVSAVTPILPHRLGEEISDPRVMYAYDALTVPVNLAGCCAGVIPAGKVGGVPVGMQVIAPDEETLFSALEMIS